MDKIGDSVCYAVLFFYIAHNELLSKSDTILLGGLLAFRLVGVSLFLRFRSPKFLVYFPNFFLEFGLGLFVIQYFSLFKYKIAILSVLFVDKILQEYFMHFKRRLNYSEKKENKILNRVDPLMEDRVWYQALYGGKGCGVGGLVL